MPQLLKSGFGSTRIVGTRFALRGGLLVLVSLVLPFILIPFLDPRLWFVGLIAAIVGYSTGEALFYTKVKRWEVGNDVRIYRSFDSRPHPAGSRNLLEMKLVISRRKPLDTLAADA